MNVNNFNMSDIPSILKENLYDRIKKCCDPIWKIDYKNISWDWARRADERLCAVSEFHPDRKPLIRIGVKDNIDCKDLSTKLGTKKYRRYPKTTSEAINYIKDDNITCKTQLTELTLGRDSKCLNPYDKNLWPGASSSGSAVSVAANICDIAIGTDSLGSVRIPAAACNLVSLKMSYKPYFINDLLMVSSFFDTIGWFARSIDDLMFSYDFFKKQEKNTAENSFIYKVGVSVDVIEDKYCFDRIKENYISLLNNNSINNVVFIPIKLPKQLWESRMDAWRLCAYEAINSISPIENYMGLSLDVIRVLLLGKSVSINKYENIKKKLKNLRRINMRSLGVDAFILPTYPFEFPNLSEVSSWKMLFPDFNDPSCENLAGYAPIASMLGWPALTIPVSAILGNQGAFNIQDSFQIIANNHEERSLLDLAKKMTV